MLCPVCTGVDTRVTYMHDPSNGYDVWWCAACGAQWKATFAGVFIQLIQDDQMGNIG